MRSTWMPSRWDRSGLYACIALLCGEHLSGLRQLASPFQFLFFPLDIDLQQQIALAKRLLLTALGFCLFICTA